MHYQKEFTLEAGRSHTLRSLRSVLLEWGPEGTLDWPLYCFLAGENAMTSETGCIPDMMVCASADEAGQDRNPEPF